MKTVINLLAAVALLSGCSSMKQTNSAYDDDVYYSGKNKPVTAAVQNNGQQNGGHDQYNSNIRQDQPQNGEQQSGQNADYFSNQESGNQQNNQSAVNNNNNGNSKFNYDDYYDYEYAARMRRFYNPVSSYGYYDNYYTNSYWYSGIP